MDNVSLALSARTSTWKLLVISFHVLIQTAHYDTQNSAIISTRLADVSLGSLAHTNILAEISLLQQYD